MPGRHRPARGTCPGSPGQTIRSTGKPPGLGRQPIDRRGSAGVAHRLDRDPGHTCQAAQLLHQCVAGANDQCGAVQARIDQFLGGGQQTDSHEQLAVRVLLGEAGRPPFNGRVCSGQLPYPVYVRLPELPGGLVHQAREGNPRGPSADCSARVDSSDVVVPEIDPLADPEPLEQPYLIREPVFAANNRVQRRAPLGRRTESEGRAGPIHHRTPSRCSRI